MRIRIRHTTVHRYDQPIDYAIQLLRLTPRNHAGQRVLSWRVSDGQGKLLPATDDGYANIVHMMSVNRRHEETATLAEGEVETADTEGLLRDAVEPLPPDYYLRHTTATAADPEVTALARAMGNGETADQLAALASRVRERVVFDLDENAIAASAAEALARGRGLGPDMAHVFLAAARSQGIPARYVTGYLWQTDNAGVTDVGHAWVEAHQPGLGWLGFDPALGSRVGPGHVRVAVGLDHADAAPVRGIRRGSAAETLAVEIEVTQGQAQQ